jgi:hypothetical protein
MQHFGKFFIGGIKNLLWTKLIFLELINPTKPKKINLGVSWSTHAHTHDNRSILHVTD